MKKGLGKGAVIAAAVASLAVMGVAGCASQGGACGSAKAPAAVKHVCKGVNACKGANSCKGKNACKGK